MSKHLCNCGAWAMPGEKHRDGCPWKSPHPPTPTTKPVTEDLITANSPQLKRDELRNKLKNELLDYATGQVVSDTPIEQHLDAIMAAIDEYREYVIGPKDQHN